VAVFRLFRQGPLDAPADPPSCAPMRAGSMSSFLKARPALRPARPARSIPAIGEDARVYGGGFILRSEREAAAEAALKDLLQSVVAA
jgi:tRNA-specific 2-thiouridylase